MVQIHVSTHPEWICLEGQVDTGRFPDRYRAVSLELWEELAETARWQALPTAGGEVAWRALGVYLYMRYTKVSLRLRATSERPLKR